MRLRIGAMMQLRCIGGRCSNLLSHCPDSYRNYRSVLTAANTAKSSTTEARRHREELTAKTRKGAKVLLATLAENDITTEAQRGINRKGAKTQGYCYAKASQYDGLNAESQRDAEVIHHRDTEAQREESTTKAQ
jgi:polynucleotide 5'-kinase involved in rRNA processing